MNRILLLAVALFSIQSLPAKVNTCRQDSTYLAKVYVFLDFSCPVCQYYLRTLQSLADEFSGKGISFAGVFPTQGGTSDTLGYYAVKFDFHIPCLVDTSQILTTKYNARVTPQAVVVSSSGAIMYSGRIDNSFYRLGRRRAIPTTFELREVLTALSCNTPLPQFNNSPPVGCIIERRKQ